MFSLWATTLINLNLKHVAAVITFHMSHRRRKMYCDHAHLCYIRVCAIVCTCGRGQTNRQTDTQTGTSVCLSVHLSAAACSHYCTDPDVTWESGRGCPLVVHYWADLQSVHGLHCYGNITRTQNVSEYMLVLAVCLVDFLVALWETDKTDAVFCVM